QKCREHESDFEGAFHEYTSQATMDLDTTEYEPDSARGRSNQRNRSWLKSARLRRHTIQVCMPGVSMSACAMFFAASHFRKLRLMWMRRSSVPQAIHSNLIRELDLPSRSGNSFSNSGVKPPELKAPI